MTNEAIQQSTPSDTVLYPLQGSVGPWVYDKHVLLVKQLKYCRQVRQKIDLEFLDASLGSLLQMF